MRLLADAEEARAFLRRDPPLWAWPLCTLGPREWPYVRLWIEDAPGPRSRATDNLTRSPLDGGGAGLWMMDHPGWGGGVQAFGQVAELTRFLRIVVLPGRAFVRTLPAAKSLVTSRFKFDWLESIVRMHVTRETLIVPPAARQVVKLTLEDGPQLVALYAAWPESRFQVSRLRQGYQYVGIRDGERLIAVAEQALAAPEDGLAMVQGVLVDPEWRGRGLAGAVTAEMTRRLFEDGFHDVVLDVRESNLPALAAYARIGYRRHVTMLAGPGAAR